MMQDNYQNDSGNYGVSFTKVLSFCYIKLILFEESSNDFGCAVDNLLTSQQVRLFLMSRIIFPYRLSWYSSPLEYCQSYKPFVPCASTG